MTAPPNHQKTKSLISSLCIVAADVPRFERMISLPVRHPINEVLAVSEINKHKGKRKWVNWPIQIFAASQGGEILRYAISMISLSSLFPFLVLFVFVVISVFSFSELSRLSSILLSAIQKKKNETNFTCTVMHNTAFAAHTNHVRGLCVSRSLNDNAIVLASSSDDGTCKVPLLTLSLHTLNCD